MKIRNTVKEAAVVCAAVFTLLLGAVSLARAQGAGTGSISGTVKDPKGLVVPGAQVVVRNVDTGAERTLTTNEAGLYAAPYLQPGRYEVRASKEGFATVVHKDLNLLVGQTLTIDFALQIKQAEATVTVTGQAPLIEPEKTESSQVVTQTLVQNLPINGRRWDNFVLLTPGVSTDGGFGLVSYRGISGLYNENSVDGANNNQAFFSEARGRTRIAYVYSMDTIKEFQVSSSNYSAEFGQAAGGIVNAVTKSGVNAIHGDLFYYLRYPSLNALDPINKAKGIFTQPEHQRQQFGGSVGGPFVKDRFFYFFTYDGSRRVFPIAYTTSNASLLAPTTSNCGTQVSLAQCAAAISFIDSQLGAFPRKGNQDAYFGKLDLQASQNNHLSVNFNFHNWRSANGIITATTRSNDSLTTNGNDLVHSRFLVANWNSTIGNNVVNEFRFQWGRDFEFESPNFPGPNVSISGLMTYGEPNFLPRPAFPDEHRWQFTDSLSVLRGRHTLKIGLDVNAIHEVLVNLFQGGGIYSYAGNSKTAFQRWMLDVYGIDILDGRTRKHYDTFTQAFDPITGTGKDDFWNRDYAAYLQDTWKLRSNLTLNLGIRYDLQTIPQPPRPNMATPLLAQLTSKINTDINNLAPRLGLAWQIDKNTITRLGYGIFYAKTTNSTFYTVRVENGVFQQTFTCRTNIASAKPADPCTPEFANVIFPAPGPSLQAPFSGALTPQVVNTNPPATAQLSRGLSRDFVNPLVHEGEVSLERQMPGSFSVSATYLFSRALRLPVFVDANIAPTGVTKAYDVTDPSGNTLKQVRVPFYTQRLNPQTGVILAGNSVVNSWYNGLAVSIRKPFSHGLELLANYTLSKATDDGQVIGTNGTFNGTNPPLDPKDQRGEQALSDLNQRHRFVSSVYWVPPFAKIANKPLRLAFDGFSFSGIVTIASGHPVTGFVSGAPSGGVDFGVTGGEVSSFGGFTGGRVPQIGRNTFTGPNLRTVDFRVTREVKITERYRLRFIGEGFNLFNHTNFTDVLTNQVNFVARSSSSTTCNMIVHANDCLVPRSDFLLPSAAGNTLYGARQLQFSARFSW